MAARKFHIRCDMEGVSGVVSIEQVTPHAAEYPQARAWFMAELLALAEGLLAGGAAEVSIYDEHWFGRNVDIARMPSGVNVLCGKPPYRKDWAGGLDANHDGLILHGLHARAGTPHLLAHTYEPEFEQITLNGQVVGEIGMETAIGGDWDVPLVMVVADSGGCDEAAALVPGVRTIATKFSQAAFGAVCRPLDDVVEEIRTEAARLAADPPSTRPLRLDGPVEMTATFAAGPYLDGLRALAGERFLAAATLGLTAPTATEAWSTYWQLKLAVQALLNR